MKKKSQARGFVKVEKILHYSQNSRVFRQAWLQHKAVNLWTEVAGAYLDDAAALTKAVSFNKGILVVACLTKEVAYQVKILALRLLEALNKLLGVLLVYQIEVQV